MGLLDAQQFDPSGYGGQGSGLLDLLKRYATMPDASIGQANAALPTDMMSMTPQQRIGNAFGAFPQSQPPAQSATNLTPDSYVPVGSYQMPMFGASLQSAAGQLPANSQPTQGVLPPDQQVPQIQSQEPVFQPPSSTGGLGGAFRGAAANAGSGPLGLLFGTIAGAAGMGQGTPQQIQQQQMKATFDALRGSGVPANLAMAAALNPEVLKTIAPAYFDGAPKLQETGTDPITGQKTFGVWEPGARKLTPIGNGNGAGATSQTQGLAPLTQAISAGVKGDQLYSYLPPGMAPTVKAMIEGRQPLPSTQAMRSPAILALIDAAHTIDPSFDATTWAARLSGQRDFASGKSSEMVRAANQTLHHVGQLLNSADNLKNGQYPIINRIGNTVNEMAGGGAPAAFRINAHAVAEEMSKVFKGTNLSDNEIRNWEQNLSENMSPEQQRAAIGKLRDLLQGSLDALQEKRVAAIGQMAADKAGPIIKPEGQAILQKLDDWLNKNPVQKTQATSQFQEGMTATNPQTGQKLTFKNGKWQ